jgi:site-specific recombinase XerD
MVSDISLPVPLFDTLENINILSYPPTLNEKRIHEYQQAISFLKSYDGSQATFNTYRREVEKLLHWAWLIAKKPITALRRADIESYIDFCQSPPQEWIGIKKAPRFIEKNGERIPNPEWRPFVVTVPKILFRDGKKPNIKDYTLSATAVKDIFAILGSFYNFLIQEDYTEVNPILHIRQKSKYIRSQQGKPKIRRLSELQWDYVIETAEHMAKKNAKHHRTLFIMTALYAMYLRISELAASKRWVPKMGDFYQDHDGLWWFTTVGKGNKQRQISVSKAMLQALKKYRTSMDLLPLPSPGDNTPLLPRNKGKGPIANTTYLRKIVQQCFDKAVEHMRKDGLTEETDTLMAATAHWLRHTGISEDVKRRPREHVRDDAGHSSSAITDKYIDVELRARHASALNKPIK